MIENRPTNEVAVDRQIETLVIRHPDYIETEQVVRDIAAESQLELFLFHRLLWTILAFLEIFLAFRFGLRLIGANPNSGFAVLMYGLTGLFTAPFNNLVPTPAIGGSMFEITTLIAMAVYALIFWAIEYIVRMAADLTFIRSFRRTTRPLTPLPQETVHTTTRTSIPNRFPNRRW